ncbi:MAG: alpha/beta hydrolase family protein, partial [Terriglobales bacterium]
PVLLIHGAEDDNIPPRHSQRIHARNPSASTLWIVPGAGHGGAVNAAPGEFEERLLKWFGGVGNSESRRP